MRLAFVDVKRGEVPPYPLFVRHCWAHRAADTGAPVVDAPPWVYSCLIEDPSEWALVQRALRTPLSRGQVRVDPVLLEDRVAHQVYFASLEVLHHFLHLLAQHYATFGTAEAHEIGEFVLWTLGFRWV